MISLTASVNFLHPNPTEFSPLSKGVHKKQYFSVLLQLLTVLREGSSEKNNLSKIEKKAECQSLQTKIWSERNRNPYISTPIFFYVLAFTINTGRNRLEPFLEALCLHWAASLN